MKNILPGTSFGSPDFFLFGSHRGERATGKDDKGSKDRRAVGPNLPLTIEYQQGPLPLRDFPI